MSDILQLYLYEKGILNIYSFTQYYEIDITLRSTRYDLLIGDGMHKMSWRDLPSWIPPPPLLVICVQMSAHDLISKPYFIVRFDENEHFLFLYINQIIHVQFPWLKFDVNFAIRSNYVRFFAAYLFDENIFNIE